MATILTVGHSTRRLPEFLGLLRAHGVELLVDVRRYPASRRHPHFGREALAAALAEAGLGYRHEEALGGRRSGRPDSPNGAWRNAGFRAYADYAATEDFRDALERLEAAARSRATSVMCAEAVPWRCHRRILADHLVARGHGVRHILGPERAPAHELHPRARPAEDGTLIYPAPADDQLEMM